MKPSLALTLICMFAVLSIIGCSTTSSKSSFLIKDGSANAEIVTSEKPTRMQKFAAEELKTYFKKITGADLTVTNKISSEIPFKIYVGQSKYTDQMNLSNKNLENGSYIMKSGKDYLVLMGRDTDFKTFELGKGPYPINRSDRKRAAKAWAEMVDGKWASPFVSYFKGYHKKLGLWRNDERGSLNAVNDFLRMHGVRWYMPGDIGEICPKSGSIALPKLNKKVMPDVAGRKMLFYYNQFFQTSVEEAKWQLRLGFYTNNDIGGHGIDNVLHFVKYQGKRDTVTRGGKPCYSTEGIFKETLAYARYMHKNYDWKYISVMPTDAYSALCQCNLCKGKDTPERGYAAILSDYVWGFVDKVAREVQKTDPDMYITNYAYASYLYPPEKIKQLPENVAIGFCQWRSNYGNKSIKNKYYKLRSDWLNKLKAPKIAIWDYYLHGRPKGAWDGVPVYFPQLISSDLKILKKNIISEGIEVARGFSSQGKKEDDPALSTNHLNVYITSRLWWDIDQDVNKLLEEYYNNYYGPAAPKIKQFIEFCEVNWPKMITQFKPINKALKLIDEAEKAAPANSIYQKRIKLIKKFMKPLPALSDKLENGRKGNPEAELVKKSDKGLVLDGKLDDSFWKGLKKYKFRELRKGGVVKNNTTFSTAWSGNSLYLGIKCEDSDMAGMVVTTDKDEDPSIFNGDSLELLLETPTHSYYQIAVNPAGAVMDLDRKNTVESKWVSGAVIKTYRGKNFWSIEMKVPAAGDNQEELNALYGVSGPKPTPDTPWYFNLCRVRKRDKDYEFSAFSPTGKNFHVLLKFAKLKIK
ncbi:MAG: DUF4838 domain-containing protein [Planctomycetota bacterium]